MFVFLNRKHNFIKKLLCICFRCTVLWQNVTHKWHVPVNRYLFLVNGDPVCVGEPLVLFYVSDAVLQVAETFRQVDLQLVAQKVFDLGTEMRWKPDLMTSTTTTVEQTLYNTTSGLCTGC